MVLNLKTEDGRRKQKWISTRLQVKGNKKRAEEMLYKKRLEYTKLQDAQRHSNGVLFETYMLQWLNNQKEMLSKTTYSSHIYTVKKSIVPFFRA